MWALPPNIHDLKEPHHRAESGDHPRVPLRKYFRMATSSLPSAVWTLGGPHLRFNSTNTGRAAMESIEPVSKNQPWDDYVHKSISIQTNMNSKHPPCLKNSSEFLEWNEFTEKFERQNVDEVLNSWSTVLMAVFYTKTTTVVCRRFFQSYYGFVWCWSPCRKFSPVFLAECGLSPWCEGHIETNARWQIKHFGDSFHCKDFASRQAPFLLCTPINQARDQNQMGSYPE